MWPSDKHTFIFVQHWETLLTNLVPLSLIDSEISVFIQTTFSDFPCNHLHSLTQSPQLTVHSATVHQSSPHCDTIAPGA